jgi:hypothetical protein
MNNTTYIYDWAIYRQWIKDCGVIFPQFIKLSIYAYRWGFISVNVEVSYE